jgi:hypothetical protein
LFVLLPCWCRQPAKPPSTYFYKDIIQVLNLPLCLTLWYGITWNILYTKKKAVSVLIVAALGSSTKQSVFPLASAADQNYSMEISLVDVIDGTVSMEFIVTVTDGDEDVGSSPRSPAAMDRVLVSSCHPNIPAYLFIVIFFSSLILDTIINL